MTKTTAKKPKQEILPLAEILEMREQAHTMADDIEALIPWLLRFPHDEALEQLRFVYERCRSIARSTATMKCLDHLILQPDTRPKQFVPDRDSWLLVDLIEWRLNRMRKDSDILENRVSRLRELMTSYAYANKPTELKTVDNPSGFILYGPFLQRVEHGTDQVMEMAALASWLVSFAPADDIRELDAMREFTGSYRTALAALEDLDALLCSEWRSPREHFTRDLSIVLLFLDQRIVRCQGRNRTRLKNIKEKLIAAQREEIMAASRRLVRGERVVLTKIDVRQEVKKIRDVPPMSDDTNEP